MINQKIIIASRSSKLAKAQTELVISKLNKVGIANIKKVFLKSKGDKINSKDFKRFGGKGLFTKEIDKLIINNKADIGVHSAKDIPGILDDRLKIGAYINREDVRDIIITKDKNVKNILELPKNSTLGTSSPRRTAYINYLRPDIKVIEMRGNIETRINKVLKNKIYSIMLAKAGINRLVKLKENIHFFTIPLSQILPSPGQGAIAIIYKKENNFNKKLCKKIECKNTGINLTAERSLIKEINGDCLTPIAALARIKENNIVLKAKLFSSDKKSFAISQKSGPIKKSYLLGKQCANDLLRKIKI